MGLLFLRLTLGIGMATHGYTKLVGGAAKWEHVGNMAPLAKYMPLPAVALGFFAMFAEFFGAILVGLGLFTRLASFLILVTMLTALHFHYSIGKGGEMALLYAGMSLAVLFMGSGKHALGKHL